MLFAVVFLTRYLDLFTTYVSLYNSVMKVLFIATSCTTVYLIYHKFKGTYDSNHDTFRIEFLVGPSFVLALIWHYSFTVLEVGRFAQFGEVGGKKKRSYWKILWPRYIMPSSRDGFDF